LYLKIICETMLFINQNSNIEEEYGTNKGTFVVDV